jgi:hypothetical protein
MLHYSYSCNQQAVSAVALFAVIVYTSEQNWETNARSARATSSRELGKIHEPFGDTNKQLQDTLEKSRRSASTGSKTVPARARCFQFGVSGNFSSVHPGIEISRATTWVRASAMSSGYRVTGPPETEFIAQLVLRQKPVRRQIAIPRPFGLRPKVGRASVARSHDVHCHLLFFGLNNRICGQVCQLSMTREPRSGCPDNLSDLQYDMLANLSELSPVGRVGISEQL